MSENFHQMRMNIHFILWLLDVLTGDFAYTFNI